MREEFSIRVIVPVASCWMMTTTKRMEAGDTTRLLVNGTPGNATYHAATDFTWESSDEKVATVDKSGNVAAVGYGAATITATSHNGLQATCEIIVTVSVDEIEISLVDAEEAIAEVGGDALQLRAVAYDLNGSSENVAQSFSWASSNNTVATVKEGEDGTATVTGLKPGTATITATAKDGSGVRATFQVTVVAPVQDFTVPDKAQVVIGEKSTLPLTVTPANATEGARDDFSWESDDKSIVTVDGTGIVTGVALGTATITVTSHNGIQKQCEVTVTNPTNAVTITPVDPEKTDVIVGKADLVLQAVAYGKDGSTTDVAQSFTWTSSNAAIATVKAGEDGTATVTGLKAGTVTIAATTTDGSDIRGTYTVTVIVPVTGLTLPESELLPVGETLDLADALEFEPADATARDVEWTSSDEKVATVDDNGVVTGIAAGTAVITVAAKSDASVTASCTVSVKRIPDKITIEPVGAHIPYEERAETVVLYFPTGSRDVAYTASSVTFDFLPDDEDVLSDVRWQISSGSNYVNAKVNDDGSLTVTPKKNALSSRTKSAQIVVRAASKYDMSVQDTYNILLARGIAKIEMNDMRIDYATTTSFGVPKPTITPSNATFTSSSDFIWMSSDPSVVSISESGYCTVNGTGVAYISMCPKYDEGYIASGSPYVTGGFSVTVSKDAAVVIIAMLDDNYNVIGLDRATIPHGGNVQLFALALEGDYTLEDLEAGKLPEAGQRFSWNVSNSNYLSIELADEESGFCLLHAARTTGNNYVRVTATCKDGTGTLGEFFIRIVDPMTGIDNIPEELSLHVGETHTFTPVPIPANVELQDFFWHDIRERDEHVASMEGNTVTALSPGKVTLTVAPVNHGLQKDASGAYYSVSASCLLTVYNYPASVRISGATEGQTLLVGDTLDLSAAVLDESGSPDDVMQGVTWTTSDAKVATIDEDGTFTAVGTGEVTITATATDKGEEDATICQSLTLRVGDAQITGVPAELTLYAGEKHTFEPALEPEGEATFIWSELSEEDAAVLTMEGDTVTAVAPGSVKVTVEAEGMDGVSATCNITVASRPASIVISGLEDGQEIAMGARTQLTATVLDADGNETGVPQEVVWDCSNWNVADMEDGLLLPYSMGEITITATSAVDDKVKASITITVGMF